MASSGTYIDQGLDSPKAQLLVAYRDKVARMRDRAAGKPVSRPPKSLKDFEEEDESFSDEDDSIAVVAQSSPEPQQSDSQRSVSSDTISITKQELVKLINEAAGAAKNSAASDPGYIKIDNENAKFTLTYPVDSSKMTQPVSPMSVTMMAYHVDVNEDAITIVTDGTTDFKLPKLEKLGIDYNGNRWIVFWAGGQSTFGSLKYTSFLISAQQ